MSDSVDTVLVPEGAVEVVPVELGMGDGNSVLRLYRRSGGVKRCRKCWKTSQW